MRKTALQFLKHSGRTPIEKITLGRDLKISKWIIEGYQELCNIDETNSITNEQAVNIGWESAFKLHQIREERLRHRSIQPTFAASSPASSNSLTSSTPVFTFSLRKVDDVKSVEEIFKEELSKIRSEELEYSNAFLPL